MKVKKKIALHIAVFVIAAALAVGAWAIWRYKIPKNESIYSLKNKSPDIKTSEAIKKANDPMLPSGTVLLTDTSYKSANLSIELQTKREEDLLYYVATVRVSNASDFMCAFAKDQFGQNISEEAIGLASRNNAILAINGDYYGWRDDGIIIRNGTLYRNKPVREMLALFRDGTMKTLDEKAYATDEKIATLLEEGVLQTFSFGPALIAQGEKRSNFDEAEHYLTKDHPRTAIGMVKPNHFVFVIVEGRIAQSKGVNLFELADIMQGLGCTEAYNLDGGSSSTLVFNGKKINILATRNLSDIIYFPK